MLLFGLCKEKSEAGDIFTSPYVSFSPDRQAWTTNAWDTDIEWYEKDTTVTIGNGICIPQPGTGQHVYYYMRNGSIPVGEWKVSWAYARCIHLSYTEENAHWHGLHHSEYPCETPYFSGWLAYCADCGNLISSLNIYMSLDAAKSLQRIEAGTGLQYYYLCPWCTNLEQGAWIWGHTCTGVSNNRYRISYQANADFCTGAMQDSFHMYNNASVYEGENVSYPGRLSRNQYEREGYFFAGWNTQADGSGRNFADEEEIANLTAADYNLNPVEGTVVLYAQWRSYEELIRTEKLSLSEGENVYYSQREDLYFVRSDGITPFMVCYSAFLDMEPPLVYRIDRGILQCETGEDKQEITVCTTDGEMDNDYFVHLSNLQVTSQGGGSLKAVGNISAWRKDYRRRLDIWQSFVIEKSNSGRRIRIVPRAGMELAGRILYSAREKDEANQIVIVADGEPPVIRGTDIFEGLSVIDRDVQRIVTDIYAVDTISGVKSLQLQVTNLDNGLSGNYAPGEDGHIRIDMSSEEILFTGDFTVTIMAEDLVGNKTLYESGTTEFALRTSVGRILPPHEAVFRAGESGILNISTWGYAERVEVEFPAEFVRQNPELNKTYYYEQYREYKKDEALQFMIPLYTEASSGYEIIVRAYKGDKKLEDHPKVSVISVQGTVLDDFRTRLR